MFNEKYGGYTFSCYAIVAVVLIALTLWIVWDERRQQKLLDEFQAQKKTKGNGSKTAS